MTAIPPDARKVVLAAVVPCDECKGTGCDELTVVLEEALYRRTTQENQP